MLGSQSRVAQGMASAGHLHYHSMSRYSDTFSTSSLAKSVLHIFMKGTLNAVDGGYSKGSEVEAAPATVFTATMVQLTAF